MGRRLQILQCPASADMNTLHPKTSVDLGVSTYWSPLPSILTCLYCLIYMRAAAGSSPAQPCLCTRAISLPESDSQALRVRGLASYHTSAASAVRPLRCVRAPSAGWLPATLRLGPGCVDVLLPSAPAPAACRVASTMPPFAGGH